MDSGIFLLIIRIALITTNIAIKRVILGVSFKIKKVKIAANIGLRKANDIPFETSILLTPSKSKYNPKPVEIIPRKNIHNQEVRLYWKKLSNKCFISNSDFNPCKDYF
ncbi:MAG: hypothetical protein P8Y70_16815 [Candidatus Lokiarchaeota archaeon]